MSDRIVIDGEINLKIALDGEIDSVIKVGHEVVTQPLEVTENGTYEAPDGVDGYNPVTVEIPAPTVQSKTVDALTTRQVVEPDDGYDYLSSVTVGGYFNPFKYVYSLNSAFMEAVLPDTVTIDFEGNAVANLYKTFQGISGCTHLILKNIGYADGEGINSQDMVRNSVDIKIIDFVGSAFRPANQNSPFAGCTALEEINGVIDMTYRTAYILDGLGKLKEVRFVPNTIRANFSIYNDKSLSADSLVSIANGLNEDSPSTLDIRLSSLLPTIRSITGNVVDSMFIADDNGETTLEQFILNVKGWTIRNS